MSARKKRSIMDAIAIKMLEERRLLTKHDYNRCSNLPVRSSIVVKQFGSWPRLIAIMQRSMPDFWVELQSIIIQDKKVNFVQDPLKRLASGTHTLRTVGTVREK